MIFAPCDDDKKLFSLLKRAVKSAAKNCDKVRDYVPRKHKFILPPRFRGNVSVVTKHSLVKKLVQLGGYDNDDELFIGLAAIKKGIAFLFEDQDDDDYKIDDDRKRLVDSNYCALCDKSMVLRTPSAIYSCCDVVYPLEKTWFDSRDYYCEDCRFFFLEGEEKELDNILTNDGPGFPGLPRLPKDLVEIIKSYLSLRRPILTMLCVGDDKKIKVQETSTITEWLPFAYCGESYDQLLILFVNCNPDSKFYDSIFTYQHEGINNKMIYF